MNSQWQTFIESQNTAESTNGGCNLFDLSHLGMIGVEGEDAEQFLQGQLTNDLRELTDEHSQLSAHCSPKGRMLANFRMLRRGDRVHLQMPVENIDAILKRLGMFKLMSKVELTDLRESIVSIGLAGDCAADLLKARFGSVPEADNGVVSQGDTNLIRLPGETPRFEIIGPTADVIDLWIHLAETAAPASADQWHLMDIRAGLPTVFGNTVEAFIPQMVNMQVVDGVSFTKGCYTGQEVVARMQYLGKLKRRMYRAEVESNSCPAPGDELVSASSSSGQGAGRVVDARPSDDGRCEMLVVVENAAVEKNDVSLGEDGPALRFMDLPYSVEDTEKAS